MRCGRKLKGFCPRLFMPGSFQHLVIAWPWCQIGLNIQLVAAVSDCASIRDGLFHHPGAYPHRTGSRCNCLTRLISSRNFVPGATLNRSIGSDVCDVAFGFFSEQGEIIFTRPWLWKVSTHRSPGDLSNWKYRILTSTRGFELPHHLYSIMASTFSRLLYGR